MLLGCLCYICVPQTYHATHALEGHLNWTR